MAYRDDWRSLEARRAALAEELAAIQKKTRKLATLRKRELEVESELRELGAQLRGVQISRPRLPTLRVASPCPASWEGMQGDDRVRFCESCQKNVYNLSAMSTEDAEAVVQRTEGEACVRYYERADGTVMTADCPVGRSRRDRRRRAAAVVAAGVLAGVAVVGATRRVERNEAACLAEGLAPPAKVQIRKPTDTVGLSVQQVEESLSDGVSSKRARPPTPDEPTRR